MEVVVCAYNSASRLPATLACLESQRSPSCGWEIVVVDNGSVDSTREVASQCWRREDTQFRIVVESRPGLSNARECGVSSSTSEFICFVDDDNHLYPDYLVIAEEIMTKYPEAGALGGQGHAVIDGTAPVWMWQGWQSHAVGPQGTSEGFIGPERGFVYGAGMVIRRSAWEQLRAAGFASLLSDREGSSLSSGGDVEICLALRLLGWKIAYSPRLKFGHLMPPARLTWDYCCRLFSAYGEANAVLELYNPWLREGLKPVLRRSMLGIFVHQLFELRRLRRRLSGPVAKDPGSVAALQQCEAEGKRRSIIRMLRSGRAMTAGLQLKRFVAKCRRVRRAQGTMPFSF